MSIRIKLNDNLYLTSDKNNFILNSTRIAIEDEYQKDKIKYKAGDLILVPYAYYSDIRGLIDGGISRAMMNSDSETVNQFFDILKRYIELMTNIDESMPATSCIDRSDQGQ